MPFFLARRSICAIWRLRAVMLQRSTCSAISTLTPQGPLTLGPVGDCCYIRRDFESLGNSLPPGIPRHNRAVKFRSMQLVHDAPMLLGNPRSEGAPTLSATAKISTMLEHRHTVSHHQSDEGFNVWVPGLPGCASHGETEAEALDNFRAAIDEYLSVADKLNSAIEMREVVLQR